MSTPVLPIGERLWARTVIDDSGCWVWTGSLRNRYGHLGIGGRHFYVHRVSYETFVGPIPDGLHIDHLCRNRLCINPDHLEPVTQAENNRRQGAAKWRERSEECRFGHLYAEHGVIRAGSRICCVCESAYGRVLRSMTPEEKRRRRDAGLRLVDLAAYFANQEAAA